MATFSLFAVTPIGLALVVTGIFYFVRNRIYLVLCLA